MKELKKFYLSGQMGKAFCFDEFANFSILVDFIDFCAVSESSWNDEKSEEI